MKNENGRPVKIYAAAYGTQLFLLQCLQDEMILIRKHLIKEAERERDEYAKQLQECKVSGKLRGNAEQLPGPTAKVSP